MKRPQAIIVAVVVIAAIAAGLWWFTHRSKPQNELALYGNVDLRQVDLAFNASERIVEVDAKEGDKVHKGQVLARLDVTRLGPQAAQADAQAAAQAATLEKLRHGSRPEEIDQARANLAADQALAADAERKAERLAALQGNSNGRALSKQEVDDARAQADQARAKARADAAALKLAVAGPRREDVDQAAAQAKGLEAQAALLHRQLVEAELVTPEDAVVRSRLVEPGDLSAPQKAAFSLALTNPKWVRAYVAETDLPRIKPGQHATVSVDAWPKHAFEGWVGFISPTAEFTPKTVQTEELRSSLVYEIRVFVKDPGDDLRQGMPATVHLPLAPAPAAR